MQINNEDDAIDHIEDGGDPSQLAPAMLARVLTNGALFHRIRAAKCEIGATAFLDCVLLAVSTINDHVQRMHVGIAAFMILDWRNMLDDAATFGRQRKIEAIIGAAYKRVGVRQ